MSTERGLAINAIVTGFLSLVPILRLPLASLSGFTAWGSSSRGFFWRRRFEPGCSCDPGCWSGHPSPFTLRTLADSATEGSSRCGNVASAFTVLRSTYHLLSFHRRIHSPLSSPRTTPERPRVVKNPDQTRELLPARPPCWRCDGRQPAKTATEPSAPSFGAIALA